MPIWFAVWIALSAFLFAYGFGVGRYQWPPFEWLKALRYRLMSGQPPTTYGQARAALYATVPGTADVVMVGDSLTEQGPWTELLPEVLNRGINGDSSAMVLSRLSEIINRRPRLVYLMVGINDLQRGYTHAHALQHIALILEELERAGVRCVLQSVLHVGRQYKPRLNRSIEALNAGLRRLATDRCVSFLDLNQRLAPNGVLAPEFTWDGLHLTGAAYRVWSQEILSSLNFRACTAVPVGHNAPVRSISGDGGPTTQELLQSAPSRTADRTSP